MRIARPTRCTHGFSLIEMVLSLSLVGLVLASLGSMLAFSMQATPRPDDAVIRITDASLPVSIMTEEIGSAISVSALTATSITFEVADRTGDDTPESVTYDWAGTPGDPLTREINGEGAIVVLPDVQAFEFEPELDSFTLDTITPTPGFSYYRELSSDTSPVGKVVALINANMVAPNVDEGYYQRLRSDAIPDGALYWVPDYVEVLLEQRSTPGAIRLEARLLAGGEVTPVAVASRVIRASDLSSLDWVRLDIPGELKIGPNDELGIVLICIEGSGSIATRTFTIGVFSAEYPVQRTFDAGATWSKSASSRMAYKLSGSFYGEASRTSTTSQTVSSLRLTVSPLGVNEASITTTVDLPAPVRITP